MKNIKIKKLIIDNFKGISHLEISLGDKTKISGRNAAGKTTIADSVSWVLFNKLSDGSGADKIRPHDENGNDIDYIEISVEMTMEIDGVENIIKKVQKQKWTKPRGAEEAVYGGNLNEYEWNAVPMAEKVFKTKVAEIVSEDIFKFSSIAGAFLLLDNKKRRVALLELAENISAEEVIGDNEKLNFLLNLFEKNTPEELYAIASKQIKENKAQLESIPVRIDELSKSKAEGNLTELQAEADNITAELSTESDTDKLFAELKALQDSKAKIITEAERQYQADKDKIRAEVNALKDKRTQLYDNIKDSKSKKERNELAIKHTQEKLDECRRQFSELKYIEPDFTRCPTCGAEHPYNKMRALKKEYHDSIKDRLKAVEKAGKELSKSLETMQAEIKRCDEIIATSTTDFEQTDKAWRNKEVELADFPKVEPDTTEIDKQIAELTAKTQGLDNNRKAELRARFSEINRQIGAINRNADIDQRIAELSASRSEIAQKTASAEKVKYALEQYSRAKAMKLTDRVNDKFTYVKWLLFEQQINGGIAEVCQATINGSIVGNGLNYGHSVLANIDICQAMQRIHDISLPIFVDNFESLSEQTRTDLPTGNQMIFLEVAENDLTVTDL